MSQSGFVYTNRTLDYETIAESLTRTEQATLEAKLRSMVAIGTTNRTLTTASIYYRDLNNGPWIGVNEDVMFSPASLLKVPLAMAVYLEKQDNSDALSNQIMYQGPKGLSQEHFPSKKTITEGQTYTLYQLVGLMLEESDNDATLVLSQYLGPKKVAQIYTDLGVTTVEDYSKYSIDVRTYAYFFRSLFNAYTLDRESSSQLLGFMAHASFRQGLVAGVPEGVIVSHKFGERVIDAEKPLVQLHDCGIVYLEPNPYILCVMTQGADFDRLADFISDVSRVVYDAVAETQ